MVWNLNGLILIAGATNFVFGRNAVLYVWLLELLMICLSSFAVIYLLYRCCNQLACCVVAECLPFASGEIITLSFSLLWGIENWKMFFLVVVETLLNQCNDSHRDIHSCELFVWIVVLLNKKSNIGRFFFIGSIHSLIYLAFNPLYWSHVKPASLTLRSDLSNTLSPVCLAAVT